MPTIAVIAPARGTAMMKGKLALVARIAAD